MPKVILKDIVVRIKDKVDKDNTNLEFYIGGEHFDYGEINITKRGLIKGSTIGPAFHMRFMPGDVLLMSRNPHLRKAGVVDFEGLCSDVSYVCRTKDENILLQRYLPFIFQTDDFWEFAEKNKHGSTNFFLNWTDFEKYEFELPEIEEQKKLTELLWSAQKTKMAYKELLLQTDELVKSQFIEMFGDPNDLDLKHIIPDAFIIRDDLRKPLNDGVRASMKSGTLYPYYGANGKVDDINQYLMDAEAICLAEDCGAYGPGEQSSYIVSGKVWVNNHAHILITKSNCNIRFANEYFRLLDISKYISGTTRAKLTQGQLKNLPMMIPSLERQNAFCEIIVQSDKSKLIRQLQVI